MTAVIEVRDLVTHYGSRLILDHVDLTVGAGEIMVIMGGSGSGKSTLLRHLLGLHAPTSGSIKLLGQDITTASAAQMHALRKNMGVSFQGGALFGSMSVLENVMLPLREHTRLDEQTMAIMARMKLEVVSLGGLGHLMPAQLSGGMIKRVALARALALDPELLFLDEPTAGLDPQRSDEFVDLIRVLHRELGFTVVMVTHDLDTIGALATRVAVLAEKKVLVEGSLDQVMQTQHPFIDAFFHGERGVRALGGHEAKGVSHGKP